MCTAPVAPSDAADDLVRPLHARPVQVDRELLTIDYAAVFSDFLRHADQAAQHYALGSRNIRDSWVASFPAPANRRTLRVWLSVQTGAPPTQFLGGR